MGLFRGIGIASVIFLATFSVCFAAPHAIATPSHQTLPSVQIPIELEEAPENLEAEQTFILPVLEASSENLKLKWIKKWGTAIRGVAIPTILASGLYFFGNKSAEEALLTGAAAGGLSAFLQANHPRLVNWIVMKGYIRPLSKKMGPEDPPAKEYEAIGTKVYILEVVFLGMIEGFKSVAGFETVFQTNADIWSALFDFAVLKAGMAWLVEAPLIWMMAAETDRQMKMHPEHFDSIDANSRIAALLISITLTSMIVANLAGSSEPLEWMAKLALPAAFVYWASTSNAVKHYLSKTAKGLNACARRISGLFLPPR